MFADRKSLQEAYDYALDIARSTGPDNEFGVVTAIHVLMNTFATAVVQAKPTKSQLIDFVEGWSKEHGGQHSIDLTFIDQYLEEEQS